MLHLGIALPFRRAAQVLAALTGIHVSAASIRRWTEAVGATAVSQAEAEVAVLTRTLPDPPAGLPRLVVGVDGAMVPLVHGEWAEVKLLSIGWPERQGDHVRTRDVTYFARLADAETFTMQALGELHRRGVETAGHVAAVQDGAPWLQGFVDLHCPAAVRILDWPHAVAHLGQVVGQLFGEGTARTRRVVARLREWLWQTGPDRVLAVLTGWQRARPALRTAVAYFVDRREQLGYPRFRAAGWPVGSGTTESGHQHIMQARLKGAGMHWTRRQVNPMLALRLLVHNGRWDTDGAAVVACHHQAGRCRRRLQHQARRTQRRVSLLVPPVPGPTALPVAVHAPLPQRQVECHPWRRYGSRLSAKI